MIHKLLVPHGPDVFLPDQAGEAEQLQKVMAPILEALFTRLEQDANGRRLVKEVSGGKEKHADAARLVRLLYRIGYMELAMLYQALGTAGRTIPVLTPTEPESTIMAKPNSAHRLAIYRCMYVAVQDCLNGRQQQKGNQAVQYLSTLESSLQETLRDTYSLYKSQAMVFWATLTSGWQLANMYEGDNLMRSLVGTEQSKSVVEV